MKTNAIVKVTYAGPGQLRSLGLRSGHSRSMSRARLTSTIMQAYGSLLIIQDARSKEPMHIGADVTEEDLRRARCPKLRNVVVTPTVVVTEADTAVVEAVETPEVAEPVEAAEAPEAEAEEAEAEEEAAAEQSAIQADVANSDVQDQEVEDMDTFEVTPTSVEEAERQAELTHAALRSMRKVDLRALLVDHGLDVSAALTKRELLDIAFDTPGLVV